MYISIYCTHTKNSGSFIIYHIINSFILSFFHFLRTQTHKTNVNQQNLTTPLCPPTHQSIHRSIHPFIHPFIIYATTYSIKIMMNYSSPITLCAIFLSIIILFVGTNTNDVVVATSTAVAARRHTRSRVLRGSVNSRAAAEVNNNNNNNNNNRKLKQDDDKDDDNKKPDADKNKDGPSSSIPPAPTIPVPAPAVPAPTSFVPVVPVPTLPTPTFSSFVAPAPSPIVVPAPIVVPVSAVEADRAPTPGDGGIIITDGRIDEGGAATTSTTTTTTTTSSSSCETEHDELQECIDSSSGSGGFEICKSCIKAATKLPTMSNFALNSCIDSITMCNGCQNESENYYNCFKYPNSSQQASSIAVVVTVSVPAPVPAATIIVPAPAPVPAATIVVPVPVPAATAIVVPAPVLDATTSSSCEIEHDELQECVDSSSGSGGFEICKSCIKAATKLPTMSNFALNSCIDSITMCNGCQSESENYYNCFTNPTQASSTAVVVTVPAPAPVPAATIIVPAPVPAAATIVVPAPVLDGSTTVTIDRTPDVVGRVEDGDASSSSIVSESSPIIGATWSDRFDSACRTQNAILEDCTGSGNLCKTCIKAATQLLSTSSFALNACIEEVGYCYGCSAEAVNYYECGKDVV